MFHKVWGCLQYCCVYVFRHLNISPSKFRYFYILSDTHVTFSFCFHLYLFQEHSWLKWWGWEGRSSGHDKRRCKNSRKQIFRWCNAWFMKFRLRTFGQIEWDVLKRVDTAGNRGRAARSCRHLRYGVTSGGHCASFDLESINPDLYISFLPFNDKWCFKII